MDNDIRLVDEPHRKVFRCPQCNGVQALEHILAIASNQRLPPDPVLDDGSALRFLPSRFSPTGTPIDPEGTPSVDLACCACREALPPLESIAEAPPRDLVLPDLPRERPLSNEIAKLVSGLNADSPELPQTIQSIVRRVAAHLNTAHQWIGRGYISDPVEYSDDCGNLVQIVDWLKSLLEQSFMSTSGFQQISMAKAEELNLHYAHAASHQELLDSLRRRCYRGDGVASRAEAVHRLRRAFPKEMQWGLEWVALEPLLIAWLNTNRDDPAALQPVVALLQQAVVVSDELNTVLETAQATCHSWARSKDSETCQALAKEAIEALHAGNLDAAAIAMAEFDHLDTGETNTEGLLQEVRDALANRAAFSLALGHHAAGMDALRQSLDEDDDAGHIEASFHLIQMRADKFKLHIEPGLVNRVQVRLEQARQAVRSRRRLTRSLMAVAIIAITTAAALWYQHSVRQRVIDEVLQLVETNLAPDKDSPEMALDLIDNKITDEPWLENVPQIVAARQNAVEASEQKKAHRTQTANSITSLESRITSASTTVSIDLLLTELSELKPASERHGGEIAGQWAVVDGQLSEHLQAHMESQLGIANDVALHLQGELRTAIDALPTGDTRFVSEAWEAAANKLKGIAQEAEQTIIETAHPEHNALVQVLEESTTRSNKAFARAKRLTEFNVALENLSQTTSDERGLTKKLEDITKNLGDLAKEMSLLRNLEVSLAAAKAMEAARHWRKVTWPQIQSAIDQDDADFEPVAIDQQLLSEAIETHLNQYPRSLYRERAESWLKVIQRANNPNEQDVQSVLRSLENLCPHAIAVLTSNRGDIFARPGVNDAQTRSQILYYKTDLLLHSPTLRNRSPMENLSIVGSPKDSQVAGVIRNGIASLALAKDASLNQALLDLIAQILNVVDRTSATGDPILALHVVDLLTVHWLQHFGELPGTRPRKLREWRQDYHGLHKPLVDQDWVALPLQGATAVARRRAEAAQLLNKYPIQGEVVLRASAGSSVIPQDLHPFVPAGILNPQSPSGRKTEWLPGWPRDEFSYYIPVTTEAGRWTLTPIKFDGKEMKEIPNTSVSVPREVIMIFAREKKAQ